ncbi:MAG: RnfABCDGE type electron transport complex subunit D [Alistipes sp.]|nr:RnfABCDGE type electron transport complex subunit D [Alistipes sp.]
MANKFFVSPSPHIHSPQSTRKIMGDVIIALLPALCVSTVLYGWHVLSITAIAVASCMLFEYLIQKFMIKGPLTVFNLSAAVTGILLAFNLPAGIPFWIVIIGAFVAIAVGKMTFGGLGKNPFNPALVGRVFLLLSYPAQMTDFSSVKPIMSGYVDVFSGATPLAAAKYAEGFNYSSADSLLRMLCGAVSGSFGEVAALALLLGFVYLLWQKVITWHIPVSVLGTMALFGFVVALTRGGDSSLLWSFPLFHLLAGGAILGAVYMATDYSTSPMTHCGMIVYGIGIGIITMCIRLWGAYPEGMSFAILIMNSTVPLINKYIKPKRFGVK